MKKIVKYSIAAGAGLLALGTLAACNNEGVKYKDYDVTVDGASYKFKIYDESMEEVVADTTTTTGIVSTTATTTASTTTTTTTEENLADEAAKSTEGRQVVLSKLVSSGETVSVPSVVTINNLTYTVTRIGAGAFIGMGDIKTVVVPETVSQIFDRAFEYCSSLQTITYNGEITKVGSALYTGTSVTKITYKGETLLNGLASGIKTLQTLELPNVVTLGEKSIYYSGDSYLTTITIGNGKLSTIQKDAFSDISRPLVEEWSGTAWDVKTNLLGRRSIDGTYYTLDDNGITYTKYNATLNNAPEEGVQYYKGTGTGTLENISGKAASEVNIVEKNESALLSSAKLFLEAVASDSTINYTGK